MKIMKKIIAIILFSLFTSSACYAEIVKGTIERVNIKVYQVIVGGRVVNVSKAMVFTENDMGTTKSIIIRDIKDHIGEKAICYGTEGKDNTLDAYKVRITEGHK